MSAWPKIPKGWHRIRSGASLTKDDRYFNFTESRWMQWPISGFVVNRKNALTDPWYIRRNRKHAKSP